MTIIAVANNIMVADSGQCSGDVWYKPAPGRRKITRAPDGSLVGGAGFSQHCQALSDWAAAGMDFENLPKLAYLDEPDQKGQFLVWLWLKPNCTLWFSGHTFMPYEIGQPYAIGANETFWEGAYAACDDPVRALRLTLQHGSLVRGEPQVEHLFPCRA